MNLKVFLSALVLLGFSAAFLQAQDVRVDLKDAGEQKRYILQRAFSELEAANRDYRRLVQGIANNKEALLQKIADLKHQRDRLKNQSRKLGKEIKGLTKEKEFLSSVVEKNTADLNELIGLVRINAKQLENMLIHSPYSALMPHRERKLRAILDGNSFPGMNDLKNMAGLLLGEMLYSSEVSIKQGSFIDRSGMRQEGDILFLGPFTQIYNTGKDIGFLLYSDKSESFFALSRPAPYSVRRDMTEYLRGQSNVVPVDISKGGAIREFLFDISVWETILSGGALIWPIMGLGLIALVLAVERFYVLRKKYTDPCVLMDKIKAFAREGRWDKAVSLCKSHGKKILPRILLRGISNRSLPREELENILQEEILKYIPRLERFLSTIGIIAKISPLLGLLGTVTGMINTFHVITYFGSSDPRLMASGISEALVTTMLGLFVAIPIMFCHTILSRVVDSHVAVMEENAIALINIISANQEK